MALTQKNKKYAVLVSYNGLLWLQWPLFSKSSHVSLERQKVHKQTQSNSEMCTR